MDGRTRSLCGMPVWSSDAVVCDDSLGSDDGVRITDEPAGTTTRALPHSPIEGGQGDGGEYGPRRNVRRSWGWRILPSRRQNRPEISRHTLQILPCPAAPPLSKPFSCPVRHRLCALSVHPTIPRHTARRIARRSIAWTTCGPATCGTSWSCKLDFDGSTRQGCPRHRLAQWTLGAYNLY